MENIEFWDKVWTDFKPYAVKRDVFSGVMFDSFFELIGDVNGKEVLDLGCGNGELSVFLAQKGARVTAADNSPVSAKNAGELAKFNNMADGIKPVVLDASGLPGLNKQFDLIAGIHILHHIEPFEDFAKSLKTVLKPGGKGIFYENNSGNKLLMLFRKNVAGRFGVPKYGDNAEYPFQPEEIEILRKYFKVTPHFPEFYFFRILRPYIFRKSEFIYKTLILLDSFVFRFIRPLRKYSYSQIVEIINGN